MESFTASFRGRAIGRSVNHSVRPLADMRPALTCRSQTLRSPHLRLSRAGPCSGAALPRFTHVSWILLGERFYEALLSFPVPVDTRALKALKQSPLALDLYAWVCYAAFAIIQKQRPPQFVAWSHLGKALGAEYGDPDDFKKKAQKALRKVAAVYDGLAIGRARGGFTIHATRLAVPQKTSQNLIG